MERPGPLTVYPSGEAAMPSVQRDWTCMTRTIAHYERIEQIGEGTYGQVYKARCKDTDHIVAMKKIRLQNESHFGMPPTVIREIKILKRLQHHCLVRMIEVVSSKGVEHLDEEDEYDEKHKKSSSKSKKDRIVDAREGYKGNLFLVLEYVSHDLTGLMDVAYQFSEVQIKCIFRQLLEALQYMHEQKFIHRDVKCSNILINSKFELKLADFGLARCIEPPILDEIHDRGNPQEFTNKVITLWYRPPEILLGATQYGPMVDIWSAGCILAELILGKPLFPGKTEIGQLDLIFDLMGTPTQQSWDGYKDLKLIRTGEVSIETEKKSKFHDRHDFRTMKKPTLRLIEKLLELDPAKRLRASQALDSMYFKSEPKAPDKPGDLGVLHLEGGHFHEFQTKKKRREAREVADRAKCDALESGFSAKEAQATYDDIYKGMMKKVAIEGFRPIPEAKDSNAEVAPNKDDTSADQSGKRSRDASSSRHGAEENANRKRDRSSGRYPGDERDRDRDRRSRRSKEKDPSGRRHRESRDFRDNDNRSRHSSHDISQERIAQEPHSGQDVHHERIKQEPHSDQDGRQGSHKQEPHSGQDGHHERIKQEPHLDQDGRHERIKREPHSSQDEHHGRIKQELRGDEEKANGDPKMDPVASRSVKVDAPAENGKEKESNVNQTGGLNGATTRGDIGGDAAGAADPKSRGDRPDHRSPRRRNDRTDRDRDRDRGRRQSRDRDRDRRDPHRKRHRDHSDHRSRHASKSRRNGNE